MELKQWLQQNLLDAHFSQEFPDKVFEIPQVGSFLIVVPKTIQVEDRQEQHLFDQSFNLILDDFEQQIAEIIDYFVIEFGGKWYYWQKDQEPELHPFKYLGKARSEL